MTETSNNEKVKWGQVTLYYLIACAVSWPFFWWRDILHWQGFHAIGIFKTIPIMWGPGVAALICFALFRHSHRRRITLWGSSLVKSLVCWCLPLLLLAAFGVNGDGQKSDHLLPLGLIIFGVFTVFGEELGWRGFLQDALGPLKPLPRYCLTGTMWELWHFTNRTHDKTLMQIAATLAVTIPVAILLSAFIGLATERSRSIIVATAVHGWVDLVFEFPGMGTYISAGFAVLLWIYVLWKWEQPKVVNV